MVLELENTKRLAVELSAVKTYGHFINGQWLDGHSGETIELTNPATRKTLAYIQAGDAVDVDLAVTAAYDAFPKWSKSSPAQRQALLRAIADKLRARQLEYAMMEALNNGKTITEAFEHGSGSVVGEPLVSHSDVRKVAFTGSRGTAQKIMHYASAHIIPQTLELGGKSANIICEDADLDAAAESIVITTIFNKGEVCYAGSRVFVHETVREELLDKVKRLFAKVKQGDPTDPETRLGAQSSKTQYDQILKYIEIGKSEGATPIIGGGPATVTGFESGLFIQPTLFENVRNGMRIAHEEIFGPVTGIFTWDDEAEMLRAVNDSIYGLGGGLWTRNLSRAHRISRAMQTGTVWVNRYYNFKPGQSIGGYKQSGIGVEATFETLHHYTLVKSVVLNLEEGVIGDFHAPPPNAFV